MTRVWWFVFFNAACFFGALASAVEQQKAQMPAPAGAPKILRSTFTVHWIGGATPFTKAKLAVHGDEAAEQDKQIAGTQRDGINGSDIDFGVAGDDVGAHFRRTMLTQAYHNVSDLSSPQSRTAELKRLRLQRHKNETADQVPLTELSKEKMMHLARKTQLGTRLALTTQYQVAVFRVEFDRDMSIQLSAEDAEASAKFGTPQDRKCYLSTEGGGSPHCEAAALGATRLVCGTTLFESHPSRVTHENALLPSADTGNKGNNNAIPLYLIPWDAVAQPLPLFAYVSDTLLPPLTLKEYRAVLVLDYTTHLKHERVTTVNMKPQALEHCSLQFLEAGSQDWRPPRTWSDDAGQAFVGSTPVNTLAEEQRELERERDAQQLGHTYLQRQARWGIEALEAQKALRRAVIIALLKDTRQVLSDESAYGILLQTGSMTGAKIAGILSGLVSPIVAPLGEMIGSIAGDALVPMLLKPVTILTTPMLVEGVSSGVQPPLTSYLIDNVTPALTETITDTMIETLSNFLSAYITDHMTPIVVKRLTKSLGDTLVPPIVGHISTEGVVEMATEVTRSLNHMLSRSVPHSVVAALTQSLTHSPLSDYYCWYCFYHQTYCQYCNGMQAPSQLYYSMFYTGWYSSYYSQYYEEEKDLHLKLLRKKEQNYEDPSLFNAAE